VRAVDARTPLALSPAVLHLRALWRSLLDRRLVLTLCAVVAVMGLVCVAAEVGFALAGWAIFCVFIGALYGLAAVYAVAGCLAAAIVCAVPWAVVRDDALSPTRFGRAALDAVLWLARSFVDFACGSLGSMVRPEVTPLVATGAALMAVAGAVAVGVWVGQRATRRPA
jgi:hypothetical protein